MSKLKDIYEGFNSFKDRFLENKKSIFSDNQVFTKENLNKITGDFCKIRVEFPLLRWDRYEEISRDIIEYDS